MRPRRTVVVFRTVIGPSFATCRCGLQLYGARCWHWRERDGRHAYACLHCFAAKSAIATSEAA